MSTNDIRAQLEQERHIIDAATEGPWENDFGGDIGQHWSRPEPWKPIVSTEVACGSYCMGGSSEGVIEPADAEFIVHARTALSVRNAQVEAVLALHEPAPNPDAGGFMEPDSHCKECNKGQREEAVEPWPCATVRAIEEAGK